MSDNKAIGFCGSTFAPGRGLPTDEQEERLIRARLEWRESILCARQASIDAATRLRLRSKVRTEVETRMSIDRSPKEFLLVSRPNTKAAAAYQAGNGPPARA